jgi:hypothetical protein
MDKLLEEIYGGNLSRSGRKPEVKIGKNFGVFGVMDWFKRPFCPF